MPPRKRIAPGRDTVGAGRSMAAAVRDARPEDLAALARLGAKLARAHHAMDPRRFFLPGEPIEDGYARWLGQELRDRDAVVLAATVRGRVVGYAYGRIEPRDWSTLRDRCGVGVDLWVEPRARGAGLGAALVEELASRLEARGAPRVVLDVAWRNPRAARLFRALGFRPTMVELTREAGAARPAARGRESREALAASKAAEGEGAGGAGGPRAAKAPGSAGRSKAPRAREARRSGGGRPRRGGRTSHHA